MQVGGQAFLPWQIPFKIQFFLKRFGRNAGDQHGIIRLLSRGQQRLQGEFLNGKLHGLWTYWDDDGEVELQQMQDGAWLPEEQISPPWWNWVRDQVKFEGEGGQ